MSFTVALAGNPNAGKSTLFNALTGSRQHVGNWPGKTVEKKEGHLHLANQDVIIVDLPGTYSLTAFSPEEIITRDFIIQDHPNVVVAVVDAANLERNLYLVIQLLEMGTPLILALNMSDLAEKRGFHINETLLSQQLGGVPIVRTVGSREAGLDQLKAAIAQMSTAAATVNLPNYFDPQLETEITTLTQQCQAEELLPARWMAIKLLEGDTGLLAKASAELQQALTVANDRLQANTDDDAETLIVDGRYMFISQLMDVAVVQSATDQITLSDRLDRVLTHRIWGIPIFLGFMWLVFQFTTYVSSPFLDWTDTVINGLIVHRLLALLEVLGLSGTWVESLLVEGILAGVGGILAFIPVLFALYFAIAVLEDSGYMARAAFVMDRAMQGIGLHGKSFLPLLVGFGCTVPAVYATRTLENETDRKITAFLATFMSCGARLPIYVILGTAVLGRSSGNMVFAMYLIGIAVAMITSVLMQRIVFRGKPAPPFVMELPPYHVPAAQTVLRHMWERSASFVKKAGTTILAASMAIWLLMAIPINGGKFNQVDANESLLGATSRQAAFVFKPAGFGNWEAVSALVTGLVAKEVIVSTMNQVYVGGDATNTEEALPTWQDDVKTTTSGFGEAIVLTFQEVLNIAPRTLNLLPWVNLGEIRLIKTDNGTESNTALTSAIKEHFSVPAALAFNIFILLYVPCISALSAMYHEFGWRWMLLQVLYTVGVAWGSAVLVFQIGHLLL